MNYSADFYYCNSDMNEISSSKLKYESLDYDYGQFMSTKPIINRGGRKQVKQGTTKRNARERNRVRYINNCFDMLRERIPFTIQDTSSCTQTNTTPKSSTSTSPTRKLSKVETLKYATAYIKQLTLILQNMDVNQSCQELSQPQQQQSQPQQHDSNYTSIQHNNANYYQNILLNNINININDCNHYHHQQQQQHQNQEQTYLVDHKFIPTPTQHHYNPYEYMNDYISISSPSSCTSSMTTSSSSSSSYSPTYGNRW